YHHYRCAKERRQVQDPRQECSGSIVSLNSKQDEFKETSHPLMLFPTDPWGQAIYVFVLAALRYLVIGGLAFLFFYVIFKHRLLFAKIQQRWPSGADYSREIF